ncbi:hypothetical protein M409DRAFT_70393 [Zasmidium cellare ATCC 36951]|uniref:AB hydrolase-1 domain-containing protein n=1 Tax=Zasmidium cellare ATCC 36951 TaxID=1080233 RepID=A0A6A6C4W6_ZASCE|nr:uncharacterized protein M409DRAFT_70393 [Zasmidium cellare ATCC 36951]KAF2160426.1 hypothetical protein M409DRAFT_70393 [Zasmidium cellare ATCC 36951]
MNLSAFTTRTKLPSHRNWYITLTAPIVGCLAARLLTKLISAASYTGVPHRPKIYHAPTQDLLTSREDDIPYPPDALPGGRDVSTPFGKTRVYEWGAESGRKILFVHGISTPCVVFARLAERLVDRGHRVMLFDLFGRGYSDAPDPSVYRQDIGLFSAQIFAVLSSSKVNWMEGFTMAGYSLGGGISADFCSYYPDLVESLVLICPGGVTRPFKISAVSKLMYNDLFPDWVVNWWMGRTLKAASEVKHAVAEEISDDHRAHAENSSFPIFENGSKASAATVVAWQVTAHPGFVPSFVSSVKYAPIHDGHHRWRIIGERCDEKRKISQTRGLKEGKMLLLLGQQDVVISSTETAEDAASVLGEGNVCTRILQGGHDLPTVNSDECVQVMTDFWAGLI